MNPAYAKADVIWRSFFEKYPAQITPDFLARNPKLLYRLLDETVPELIGENLRLTDLSDTADMFMNISLKQRLFDLVTLSKYLPVQYFSIDTDTEFNNLVERMQTLGVPCVVASDARGCDNPECEHHKDFDPQWVICYQTSTSVSVHVVPHDIFVEFDSSSMVRVANMNESFLLSKNFVADSLLSELGLG